MPRTTNSPVTRKRHKRILKRARGFYGARSKLIRQAMNAVDYADAMAFRGRHTILHREVAIKVLPADTALHFGSDHPNGEATLAILIIKDS